MLSPKKKKKGAFITFFLSTILEIAIIALFLTVAIVKSSITMYETLLWAIILFIFIYWSNSAYNGFCVDENGKSVLTKGTRKVFNFISLILSIALFAVGALVFADYYFIKIF